MTIGGAGRTGLAALLLASVSTHAMAQTTEEKIAVLEARVAELTAALSELKASIAKADQELVKKVAAVQAPAPQTIQTTLAAARPTIATTDGSQKFAVRTVVQFDAAAYDEKSNAAGANDLSSGTNFRRARLGIEGTFAKSWNYALTGEFGGSGGESAQLNQGYVEYTGWKPFGDATQLRLRLGAWPSPANLEDATNLTEALFLERGAPPELVRNIAGGDGRTGAGILANGQHWYAHAVLTGAVLGVPATPEFDEQVGYLTRVAFNPIHGKDYGVHIGANLSGILEPADTGAGAVTTRQVRLRERPELRIDGARLVDTGNLNADGVTAYGGELSVFYKAVHASAEAFRIDVDRTGVRDVSFDGWYVQGAWVLTGETRAWASNTGGLRGIKPASNFDPAKGQWGAVEIAARYSVLDLDDHAGVRGAATPAGGVRGGEQTITTLGLNWYPNAVFRFQLQYQMIDINRLSATGVQVGEDVDVVSLRSQFAF